MAWNGRNHKYILTSAAFVSIYRMFHTGVASGKLKTLHHHQLYTSTHSESWWGMLTLAPLVLTLKENQPEWMRSQWKQGWWFFRLCLVFYSIVKKFDLRHQHFTMSEHLLCGNLCGPSITPLWDALIHDTKAATDQADKGAKKCCVLQEYCKQHDYLLMIGSLWRFVRSNFLRTRLDHRKFSDALQRTVKQCEKLTFEWLSLCHTCTEQYPDRMNPMIPISKKTRSNKDLGSKYWRVCSSLGNRYTLLFFTTACWYPVRKHMIPHVAAETAVDSEISVECKQAVFCSQSNN